MEKVIKRSDNCPLPFEYVIMDNVHLQDKFVLPHASYFVMKKTEDCPCCKSKFSFEEMGRFKTRERAEHYKLLLEEDDAAI